MKTQNSTKTIDENTIIKAAEMTRLLIALAAKATGRQIVVKPWAIERAAVALRQERETKEAKL